MNFEDELERRLADSVRQVDADPDLSWVEAAADRRHRRHVRYPAALGALAVLALGLGATVMFARDPAGEPGESAQDVATTASTQPTDTAQPTDTTQVTDPTQPPTLPPVVDPAPAPSTETGPAAPFLDDTVEVYRRVVGDREIVVRRSERSWADLFDLEWRAPTGSAELCMGDRAMFIGDPSMGGQYGGSAWTPIEVFDEFDGEVTVDQGFADLSVVRTSGPADEVAVAVGDTEFDRASFIEGLAVVDTAQLWSADPDSPPPSLVLVSGGVAAEPIPLTSVFGRSTAEYQSECMPGPLPSVPLPPAGQQPDGPVAAEAAVLDVYERALDRTVPLSAEDPVSVDDPTGIEDAVAALGSEGNSAFTGEELADAAANAEHDVDELVFTSPDEAWFRYTLTTSLGVFGDRYGIARFDGSNWQITRDTICQDLALAGAPCVPASVQIEPPEPEGWSEVLAEYEETAALYWSSWDCLPSPFGPGPCEHVDTDPQVTAVPVGE